MILCVGTSGSGKSVLLRHLQVHNVVSEGVAGSEGEEDGGASLRSTIPTVGTNLATLSRSRTKKTAVDLWTRQEIENQFYDVWNGLYLQ